MYEQLKRLGRASVLDLHENAQFQHVRMIGVQPQQLIVTGRSSTSRMRRVILSWYSREISRWLLAMMGSGGRERVLNYK